jgi:hypothetical protein
MENALNSPDANRASLTPTTILAYAWLLTLTDLAMSLAGKLHFSGFHVIDHKAFLAR